MAIEISTLDILTINAQTRKLLRTVIAVGMIVRLWLIWSQVLPALAILDQITLWNTLSTVDGHEASQPITLANLARAVLLMVAVVVAARNIPGVLAVIPGNRYAVSQVVRYAIVAVGIFAIISAVSGSWSQVQWLVAALSIADLDAKLKEVQALRQAIFRHAFTGQLVPQDPNDEPASELLKRVAAEREKRAPEATSRRPSGHRRQSARGSA